MGRARVGLRAEWRDHGAEMSRDLQVTFAALQTLTGVDFVDAMRLRAGLRREAQRVFADVDLLALPTTAETATRRESVRPHRCSCSIITARRTALTSVPVSVVQAAGRGFQTVL